jgi:hypothetical protein
MEQNPLLSKHADSESPVESWYHAGNVVTGSTGPTACNTACDAGAKTRDSNNTTTNGITLSFERITHPPLNCKMIKIDELVIIQI